MNSVRLLFALGIGALATQLASAQAAAGFQAGVLKLRPTHFWALDRGYAGAGSAPGAALSALGGRFAPDLDNREAGAFAFDAPTDGLLFSADPVTGGGRNASAEADGTGSITLLFRTLKTAPRGQRFLFAQGAKATDTHNALGLFVQNATAPATPGALVLRVGNSQVTLLTAEALRPETWYFFALTWDEARRADQVSWYCGVAGEAAAQSGQITITQRAVVGNDGPFMIGYSEEVGSSAYRDVNQPGVIDAFSIFDRELKAEEIQALHALLRGR